MSAKDIIIAAAGGGQTTTAIEYVGGKTVTITPSASSNTTIFLTDLTGSPDPTLQPGDVVIVSYVIGSGATGYLNPNAAPTVVQRGPFIPLATLYTNDSQDTSLYCGYKVMGFIPDTSIYVTATTNVNFGGCVAIQAYRYTDTNFPIQQPANTTTIQNTVRPTPPTITPWDNDSVAVIVGAGSHTRGNVAYTTTGLTSFISTGSTDVSEDASIGMGFRVIQSGSYSPNRFGFPQSDFTGYSCAALSIALKPKPDVVIPSFISYRGVGITTGATVTITAPTGIQENDFLLLTICSGTLSDTITSVPSGFTLVRSDSSSGSISFTYKKIATASEPASYSISHSVTSADFSCVISVFRNATTINASGTADSGTAGTITVDGITPTVGGLNLAIWLSDSADTIINSPAGMVERVNFTGSGTYCAQFIFTANAGAYFLTENRSLTRSDGSYVIGFQLQLTNE